MARATSSRRSRRRRRARAGAGERAAARAAVPASPAVESAPAPEPSITVRPRRGTPRPADAVTHGRARGRIYRWTHPRFFMEIYVELRKVVWPSRMETRNLTTVVVIVAVAVGAVLGAVDWVFNRLLENVLLR